MPGFAYGMAERDDFSQTLTEASVWGKTLTRRCERENRGRLKIFSKAKTLRGIEIAANASFRTAYACDWCVHVGGFSVSRLTACMGSPV